MKHRYCAVGFLFVWAIFGAALPAWSQAPLTVTGVSDRGISTGSASFTVPTVGGHNYLVLLNGKRVPPNVIHQMTRADYYELSVTRTNALTLEVTNRLVRFIVQAPGRGSTERGLIAWTPYPTINSSAAELAGARVDLIMPDAFPAGLEIPVIAWIRNAEGNAVRANGLLASEGHPSIQLRRGVGSGYLAATNSSGSLNYAAQVAGVEANNTVQIQDGTVWTEVSGTLGANVTWGENSRIAVTADITIPAGGTLRIREGSVVRLSSLINITNHGRITIEGTTARPVVFTPTSRAEPWGGFFLLVSAARLDATGAIFVAAGGRQSGFQGHRNEQPLFYLDNRPHVALTNCAAIDLAGQFHHSRDRGEPFATVTMVGSLIQRCTTAGEFNGCSLRFIESALLEVPVEDGLICDDPDCDYDGFYLNRGYHELRNSVIGWVKDDAIDAGSGGGPSTVLVTNCWIESAFHEGLAYSERNRSMETYDTVLINNGQAVEAGWTRSSPNNDPTFPMSPDVFAERILAVGNSVGARFGDNYNWGYRGFLRVTNSFLLHNYHNIFGKTWNTTGQSWDTNQWVDRLEQMDLRNNYLSAPDPKHPDNLLWYPSEDGWRLARFMTTPPDAPVGIGLAVWTNRFLLSSIFNGVPVRLSSFTTNFVSVNYTFESAGPAPEEPAVLAEGTLTFAPGETVKYIHPAGFHLPDYNQVELVLRDPVHGELTGQTRVRFVGVVVSPLLVIALGGTQADFARVAEGTPVMLNAPSAQSVRVGYKFQTAGGTLAEGTLHFEPGQTLAWVEPPPLSPEVQLVRFTLSDPEWARLSPSTNAYYVFAPAPVFPPPLVHRGSVWKYDDTATDLGASWRAPEYDDSAWSSGPAQLGFGDGDEATVISNRLQLAFYFRQSFTVENSAALDSLSIWLLRDDAGVVYLNGTEVFRSPNLPAFPTPITFTTRATSTGENTIDTATISTEFLNEGSNVVAVQIQQERTSSSDVSFDFELTGTPLPERPRIHQGKFDGRLVLVWSGAGFVFEQADEVTGPWTALPVPSPRTITPSENKKFFRLRR